MSLLHVINICYISEVTPNSKTLTLHDQHLTLPDTSTALAVKKTPLRSNIPLLLPRSGGKNFMV